MRQRSVIHRPPGNEPTIAVGRKETSSVKPQAGSYASWLTLSERPSWLTECLATYQLDKTPEFKRTVTPEYPPNLVDQETQGRILIVFKVSVSCQFEHWPAKPGSNAQLAQSSVKAMRQWTYGPALPRKARGSHQQSFSYRIE